MHKQFNLRILSAIIIGISFVSAILWFELLFFILMIAIAIGMLNEWFNMLVNRPLSLSLGLLIIPIPVACLIAMRETHVDNLILLMYFLAIWTTDSFAMIGGKILRGPKLYPSISPNKTWSGLICGMSASGVTLFLISTIKPDFFCNFQVIIDIHPFLLGTSIALVAQLSDLFISYFKRKSKVKDSGNIIPGHGGVLDRFDSIILTAPLLYLLMVI